jgi:signal transduction histidine kinase
LLIAYDVAEIRQTRVALDLSEETRQAILNAIPDLVFKVRKDGRIMDYYLNRSQSGPIPWEELKARTIGEFMSAEETAQILHSIDKCIKGGGVEYHEFQTFNLETEYWFELRFSKLSEQEVIVIVRDITDQKKTALSLDEKLAEISLKNVELERYITSNSELEKFAYITSHDLKEPVRSIIGFAQLLQKKGIDQLDAEHQEYLGNIISGARRMSSLINGLLDYSRINSQGKAFEEMEVEEVLSKVKMDLLQITEETKALIIHEELPRLYGDRLQIRQLFQNIITNSIKFRSAEPPKIHITCTPEGGFWLFKVQDNGIGFDMKYKDKLFALFSRLHTSDQYPGTGIGLALCKKIVDRHNGRIWLESSPGNGTSVLFTIPA